jgi:hypothetical protein
MQNDGLVYRGVSMLGTLRFGDEVLVDKRDFSDLSVGDVIVYQNPQVPTIHTIHRIISKNNLFVTTQGDNTIKPDPYKVTADSIIGSVTTIIRHGKALQLRGGRLGLLRARFLHLHRRLRASLSWATRPLYEKLGRSIIEILNWRPNIEQLTLATSPRTIIKYITKGKTVAQWDEETDAWHCHKPYDLILKKPNRKHSADLLSQS